MTRRFIRLGKFVITCLFFACLNIYLFFRFGAIHEYSGLIPKCIRTGNTDHCENELIHSLPKIIVKIITLRTLLPESDYKELWEIHETINKLITREGARRVRKSVPNQLRYSCEETYNGTTFGYPYFLKGFLRVSCQKTPVAESTAIIIDRPITEADALERILNYAIGAFQKVFVIFPYNKLTHTIKYLFDRLNGRVQVFYIKEKLNLGKSLNTIVDLLNTHFVLIAPYLGRLDNNTDIERLINVHERSGAHIIGSAVKNVHTGEWERGCYQSKIHVYTLKYLPGYLKSLDECLFCMYLPGPFIARTDLLRRIPFQHWTGGVYRDLFLRVAGEEPNTIMACPDVLFYILPQRQRDSDLSQFAKNHDVRRIVDVDRTLRWFGGRVGYNHTDVNKCQLQKSMIVPPECRQNLLDVILFILRLCEESRLRCELQEGTLLGAMKFNNILPWERDADITVLSAHFNAFSKLDALTARGYSVRVVSPAACCFEGVITGGVMTIHAHGWNIEIYGQHKLTTGAGDVPRTKVLMGEQWVATPENPGLYVRNRYGREVYRHAEHWMATGKNTGWAVYESGYFAKCTATEHHGCLDQFRADGDLQFRNWL